MIAQQRRQEAMSNNIANANTPGYRADQTPVRAFPEMLMQKIGTKNIPTERQLNIPTQQLLVALNTGAYVQETIPNWQQGDLRETGSTTDIAITQADIPDKTGNRNCTVDEIDMHLKNEGLYSLDTTGNTIDTDQLEFTVEANGTQVFDDGTQVQLGLQYASDASQLTNEGNDLFAAESAAVP